MNNLTDFKINDIVLVEIEYETNITKQYPVLLTIVESRNFRQLSGRSLIPCRSIVAGDIVVYSDEVTTYNTQKLYGNFSFNYRYIGVKKIMSKKDLKIFKLETRYEV